MKYLYIATALISLITTMIIAERVMIPHTTPTMHEQARIYGEVYDKPSPDFQFVYDGCTLFPNTLPGLDLKEACFGHDVAYYHGGSKEERKAADKRLKEEASAQGLFGQIMQYPVYIGVRIFGDSFLTKLFNAHWGFGHI